MTIDYLTGLRYTSQMKKVLLMTCLLAACRTTSPPPTKQPDSPDQDLPVQWLIWTTSDSGPRTHRIENDGKGGFRALGEADGAWIGVPDSKRVGVWEFDRELIATKQTDCDCEMEAMNAGETADCALPAELDIGVLRAFPTGPIINIPPDSAFDGDTRQLFPNLDGSAGPYVFTTVCIDQYACGSAHGDSVCSQQIYDLRTGQEVLDYEMAATPLRGPQMLQFVREAYEDEHEAAEIAEEDVVFSWVAPRYEKAFVPRMEEQYTGPACYACSDGLWDSYTISSRRTVDQLPTLIAAWLKEAPQPPSSFADQLDATIGGWSLVPADAALRGHLDGVFEAPHAPR